PLYRQWVMIASIIVANPPRPNFPLTVRYEDEPNNHSLGRGGRSFSSCPKTRKIPKGIFRVLRPPTLLG
ncbi:hypothetical protein, partial [uncultured Varibaculum sp.]|uniref:hypothetical protein n=1 Tax=uncultured Varibaculum sp. TaxID=413896 RepID=UPI002597BA09